MSHPSRDFCGQAHKAFDSPQPQKRGTAADRTGKLGFSKAELEAMLENAGFTGVQTSVVHKEPETPQFQTLLAVANKPLRSDR